MIKKNFPPRSHGMSYPIAGNVKTHSAKGYSVEHALVVSRDLFHIKQMSFQTGNCSRLCCSVFCFLLFFLFSFPSAWRSDSCLMCLTASRPLRGPHVSCCLQLHRPHVSRAPSGGCWDPWYVLTCFAFFFSGFLIFSPFTCWRELMFTLRLPSYIELSHT